MQKLETLCHPGENVKWYSTVENRKVICQKIKHREATVKCDTLQGEVTGLYLEIFLGNVDTSAHDPR